MFYSDHVTVFINSLLASGSNLFLRKVHNSLVYPICRSLSQKEQVAKAKHFTTPLWVKSIFLAMVDGNGYRAVFQSSLKCSVLQEAAVSEFILCSIKNKG